MTNKLNIYISWLVLAIFYLYIYLLRSSPGVLIEEIRFTFRMNADNFALMGSMYYYGYSLVQVPLGLIVDKHGVRKTVIYSILLCIIGTILIISTKNNYLVYLSRLLVGVGTASAFMCSLKLANDFLPKSLKEVAIGATLTFGSFGALLTGTPLNYILKKFTTWQASFLIFVIIGIFILVFVLIFLPKTSKSKLANENTNILEDIYSIITNKQILIYAIIAIGLYSPLSVIADLWGTAFIVKKFNLTREIASPILMNIYIGMAVGSVIVPYFGKVLGINRIIRFSSISLLILFSFLVYAQDIDYYCLVAILVLIGFFCGAEMLCFAAALHYAKPNSSGLTIGVVNTLNMLSGAILQHVIGIYLDYNWKGVLDINGLRIYSVDNFIEAFSILIGIMVITTIIAFIYLKSKKTLGINE